MGQVIEDESFPDAGRDQEIKDAQQAELAEARADHQRRMGRTVED